MVPGPRRNENHPQMIASRLKVERDDFFGVPKSAFTQYKRRAGQSVSISDADLLRFKQLSGCKRIQLVGLLRRRLPSACVQGPGSRVMPRVTGYANLRCPGVGNDFPLLGWRILRQILFLVPDAEQFDQPPDLSSREWLAGIHQRVVAGHPRPRLR
jgi:hypothetical protein